jgi:hypothetical protein
MDADNSHYSSFSTTSCITRGSEHRFSPKLGDEIMVYHLNDGWQLGLVKKVTDANLVVKITTNTGIFEVTISYEQVAAIMIGD